MSPAVRVYMFVGLPARAPPPEATTHPGSQDWLFSLSRPPAMAARADHHGSTRESSVAECRHQSAKTGQSRAGPAQTRRHGPCPALDSSPALTLYLDVRPIDPLDLL